MSGELEILDRLDRLERMLAQALGQRKPNPDVIPWQQIAVRLGIDGKAPDQAARRRIHRARNAGAALRVTRHGVERVDFERWLKSEFAKRPSMADRVRLALAGVSR